MWLRGLLIALSVMVLPAAALGFDDCERLVKDAKAFGREASAEAVERAPVKYREMARSIRLVVEAPDTMLIPFASEQQGTKLVVLPLAFARLACQMSLATYLELEGVRPQERRQAAGTAAACIDAGRPRRACLLAFGDDLAKRYRSAFAQLSAGQRGVARALSRAAQWQVAQHEYAHHYLNHHARLKAKQVSRIDAEFEADLYAITNGMQAGDPASAMYYVFAGLADIEDETKKLATPDYESGACRANNVDNIAAFVSIVPLVVMDAAGGGGLLLRTNSPTILRQRIDEHFGRPMPTLRPGSCGHIEKVALAEIYAELKRLALRVNADAEMLFSKQTTLDNARAARLVHDLAALTGEFRYADGIASKSIAFMLRGWGLKGRSGTPLMTEVDRLFENKRIVGNLQSEDYGRIRASQGLVMLQERVDVPAPARLERSARLLRDAVAHNPRISEAWANLAMISFKRGECDDAARHAERAVATHTGDKKSRDAVAFMAQKLKGWASSPAACREAAANFHPYKGL